MTEKTDVARTTSEILIAGEEIKQKLDPNAKDKGATDLRAELKLVEHKMSIPELCEHLGSNTETGMTSHAAKQRQMVEGKNKLTPPKGVPEWVKFMRTQTGFFSLLLWGGSILCFIGFGLKKEVDNLYLGLVLAFVVLLTGIFSYSQERKSSNLMDSFKNMMTTETLRLRDGKFSKCDAEDLVRGDVVRIKSGDKVPADLRVLECSEDMKVDNSCLTGESDPLSRQPDFNHENPLETANLCFFGTLVPSGTAKCMVINIGDNTVMGRIAKLTTQTEQMQSPINIEIEHFVMIVSGVAIFLGVSFFIIGAALGVDWISNLVFMIGIIVANVPEGLLATVTVCLTLTAKRMHSKSVLVKNLEAVETLGSTTCICSDKTGTLTQNIMTVTHLVFDQKIWESKTSTTKSNFNTEDPTFQRVLTCATCCNSATFEGQFEKKKVTNGGVVTEVDDLDRPVPFEAHVTMGDGSTMEKVMWTTNGDASESAMIKFAQRYNDIMDKRAEIPQLFTLPFNSTNKFMLTIHGNADGGDRQLLMKGAPERIISRCDSILIDGEVRPYTPEEVAKTGELQTKLSKMGRRVLGLCQAVLPESEYPADYEFSINNPNFPMGVKPEDLQENADVRQTEKLVFLGLIALIDPPRPQVPPAVAKCKTAGIKVVMVTGDHPETAKAIAKEVGIIWGKTREDIEEENASRGLSPGQSGWQDPDLAPAIVVPGWTINNTDTTEEVWDDILDHQQIVFARTSPQQKLIIVENFQRRKEVVAVTGDGVNDAPALKKADIGVAMGIMGSDVSKEAADMILIDDNFASIVSGVEEGRLIFDNLKKSIAYTLSSNIPEISPFLAFITIQIPLPLSTILILCIDLGTDMVPAISMAWETPEADIMRRNPRNAAVDRLVTKKLVCFAYLQIGVIQACAGFYAWMTVLNDYGYPPHILPGLGAYDNWGKQHLFCKLTGGVLRNLAGDARVFQAGYANVEANFKAGYLFWDPSVVEGLSGSVAGTVDTCDFAVKNFVGATEDMPAAWTSATFASYPSYTAQISVATSQSYAAMHNAGYVEYLPYRSRMSVFWRNEWMAADMGTVGTVVGAGPEVFDSVFFSVPNAAFFTGTGTPGSTAAVGTSSAMKTLSNTNSYTTANIVYAANSTTTVGGLWSGLYGWQTGGKAYVNAASRMMQKEALAHAQTAGFICIIVVQWADLTICKTRWLSIRDQGMRNPAMNFGLLFETILGAFLCYSPVNVALGTRPLRLTHWFPGMPFSVLIFTYDEVRKFFMRKTSSITEDPETKRITRHPGWLERNTYY